MYMQNLLCHGGKDYRNIFTKDYSSAEKSVVTWEHFFWKFTEDYVPLVERERLAQELLSFKYTSESVVKITKMFTDRALFFPVYVSSEQVKMYRYLSILKTDIWDFISNNRYKTLAEM